LLTDGCRVGWCTFRRHVLGIGTYLGWCRFRRHVLGIGTYLGWCTFRRHVVGIGAYLGWYRFRRHVLGIGTYVCWCGSVGVLTLHWTFPRDYAIRKATLQDHGTQHKCIYVCMQVLNVQKQQKSKMTTDNHRKPSAATKRPSTNTQPAPKRVHHPDVAGPSNVPTLVCINPTCCVHHSQISNTIPKSVTPLPNL